MGKYSDWLWPRLEAPKPRIADTVFDAIGKADWDPIDPVLEEARALALRDDERRKSADTKATIYLAVLAAIVPMTAALAKEFYTISRTFDAWFFIVVVMLFLLGSSYMLAAGIWAFRTIRVIAYHRLDVAELTKLPENGELNLELCREVLRCVKRNQTPINDKTTRLIMAHEFLLRLFILYVVLVLFVGTGSVWPVLNKAIRSITHCLVLT